jgi:hypothetical protein
MRCVSFAFAALCVIAGCDSRPSLGGTGPADGGGSDGGSGGGSDAAVASLCTSVPTDLTAARLHARGCPVGADAALFLRAAPYSKIVIEVGATTGAQPRQAAIDHLVAVLQDLTSKPGGVTVLAGATVPAPGHPLTVDDVRALEDQGRTRFSFGDTAVFYYLVVSDPSAEDTSSAQLLGLAHRAASMVVFQGTIDQDSGGIGQPSSDVVESTVVAHELGHVLGLVNLGAPMQTPHEDSAHPAHDVNQSCVMYWANNSSQLVANLISGGVIPDFDASCRADLAALRDAP